MSFCLAASFHTSIDAANDNARVGRWPALLLSARERVGRRGGNERAGEFRLAKIGVWAVATASGWPGLNGGHLPPLLPCKYLANVPYTPIGAVAACCEVRGGTRASGDGHLLTPIVNRRARSEGNKRASEVVGSGGGDVGKSEDQEWTRKRKVVHERGRVVGAGEGRWAGVASALQMAGGGGLGCSSNPWPLPQLMMELPSWPLGSIAGVHGSLDVLCKTRGDAEYDGPFFHAPVVLTTYYYSVLPAAISPPPSSLLPPTPPLNQAL
ncbi:hypothetical protein BD779DRAFT_1482359 [Infundibulicybe gibba]|nr:hypothetical protein BD779DRAFT_1482359 [Infundibulicybe gibba]